MINCSDNDPCWCGSGKNFKECHKYIGYGAKPSIGKISKQFFDLKKKKMCLYPDKRDCSKEIINSHSIQNSISLDCISENGEVYRFVPNLNARLDWYKYNTMMPIKIGKKKTSIFYGFCKYHDNLLFKEIDAVKIIPTLRQSALLAIRSIAREIYEKRIHSNLDNINKEIESSKDKITQIQMEVMNRSVQHSVLTALDDLSRYYGNFFNIYFHEEFHRINRLVIHINKNPEIMCSGCFNPLYDLNGNELQDLDDDYLEMTTFEILSNGEHGIIHFCWHDDFTYCKKFFDSLLSSDDIPNSIVKLMFMSIENHAINISWFDNLSVIQKKGLMKLIASNFLPELNSEIKALILDRRKYVDWQITNIEKLY
jgi:hypothetical protein